MGMYLLPDTGHNFISKTHRCNYPTYHHHEEIYGPGMLNFVLLNSGFHAELRDTLEMKNGALKLAYAAVLCACTAMTILMKV